MNGEDTGCTSKLCFSSNEPLRSSVEESSESLYLITFENQQVLVMV